jgi:hypothetical protein
VGLDSANDAEPNALDNTLNKSIIVCDDVLTPKPVGPLEDGSKKPCKEDTINPGSQVPPAIKNGDKECTSPNCNNGDHLESEKNAATGVTPSHTDVERPGQTSTTPEDKQEEIIPRKSTRSKQLPVNKYQDFLY